MTLLLALSVGVLFGCGTFLVLKPDLLRVVAGVVLISNAASLTLMSSGRSRGASPILPLSGPVSDPLVQAMTVTAVVIGFAVCALLLSLVYRIYTTHRTVDLNELAGVEARYEGEHEAEEEELAA